MRQSHSAISPSRAKLSGAADGRMAQVWDVGDEKRASVSHLDETASVDSNPPPKQSLDGESSGVRTGHPPGRATRYRLVPPSVYMHRGLEILGHTPRCSSPTRMLR